MAIESTKNKHIVSFDFLRSVMWMVRLKILSESEIVFSKEKFLFDYKL